jgi:hypothetical protein
MKKLLALVAAALLLSLAPTAALAVHKDGHQRPPACDISQGQAPEKNKHCYPPLESEENSEGRALGPNFPDSGPSSSGPSNEQGGIAVWMVALGAAGLLGASLLARQRVVHARKVAPKPS